MTDETQVAPEATEEVVQPEAEQPKAPEAVESTEGQPDEQPAEGDEGETPETPEEEVSDSKARRERRKALVSRLHEELETEREKRERLEAELAQVKEAKDTPPPKQDDFEDYDDYVAAKAAHASVTMLDARQLAKLERDAAEQDQRLQQLQQQRKAEAQQNWAAQRDDAAKRYADFDAVVSAPDLAVTDKMADLLMQSDSGADIAYHLGMNKALARQIAGMEPIEQAMAIGRLEATVSNASRPRTTTKAPDPVTPVKAKATATKSVEDMTMAEYEAARAAGKI